MNLQWDHITGVPPFPAAGFINVWMMEGLSPVIVTLLQMHSGSKSRLFSVSGLFLFYLFFNMGARGAHLVIMIPEPRVDGAAGM